MNLKFGAHFYDAIQVATFRKKLLISLIFCIGYTSSCF